MTKMLQFPGKKLNKKAKGDAITKRAKELNSWMNAVFRLVNGKDEQCQTVLAWCTSSKGAQGSKSGDF